MLTILDFLIFDYRINRGWYGSSELEAKEIIGFTLKNSEDIDFTDGDAPKSIIRPEDIQQIVKQINTPISDYL